MSRIILLFCILFIYEKLRADEFDFGEDFEVEPTTKINEKDKLSPLKLPFRGKLGLGLARQTSSEARWTKLAPKSQVITDYSSNYGSLYSELTLVHNEAYRFEEDPKKIIDKYSTIGTIRELYYKKSFENISISLGRKMTVWGAGDFLSVVNLITPADQSELFFADPENTRLGQDSIILDYYSPINLTVVYSPKPQMNINPIIGHPYGFIPDIKQKSPEEAEISARASFSLSDHQFSLLAGKVHQRDPIPVFDNTKGQMLSYMPYQFTGMTYTKIFGPVLLKAEYTHYSDYELYIQDQSEGASLITTNVNAGMLGFDYNHDTFGSFLVEANMLKPEAKGNDSSLIAVSWSKSYLQDELSLNFITMGFKDFGNQLNRFAVNYRITDNIEIVNQYTRISIESDDQQFRLWEDLDRYDFTLNYSFDLSTGG